MRSSLPELASLCCLHPAARSWEAAEPSADLSLPPQNTYLPSDFSLVFEAAGPAPQDGSAAAGSAAGLAAGAVAAANGHAAGAAAAEEVERGSPAEGAEEGPLVGDDAGAFPSPPELLVDEPGLRCWAAAGAAGTLRGVCCCAVGAHCGCPACPCPP